MKPTEKAYKKEWLNKDVFCYLTSDMKILQIAQCILQRSHKKIRERIQFLLKSVVLAMEDSIVLQKSKKMLRWNLQRPGPLSTLHLLLNRSNRTKYTTTTWVIKMEWMRQKLRRVIAHRLEANQLVRLTPFCHCSSQVFQNYGQIDLHPRLGTRLKVERRVMNYLGHSQPKSWWLSRNTVVRKSEVTQHDSITLCTVTQVGARRWNAS